MEVIFLSSIAYQDANSTNYGDCILIDTGSELIIYDCGSEAHAETVLKYMHMHSYSRVTVILSHNDKDHFDGINTLISAGVVSDVYTLLLLKHKDELLNLLDDDRITRDSLGRRITEAFENISSLSKKVKLHDTLTEPYICDGIGIVGPDKEYALNAVAKLLDHNESDTIDNETIMNAVSCHIAIRFTYGSLLLCGDSNYEAIKNKLPKYSAIQLPHHGKYEHARKIMNDIDALRTGLYVSDNTGNSNGGSDELMDNCRGYRVFNTKTGNQTCNSSNIKVIPNSYLGKSTTNV